MSQPLEFLGVMVALLFVAAVVLVVLILLRRVRPATGVHVAGGWPRWLVGGPPDIGPPDGRPDPRRRDGKRSRRL